MLNNIAALYNSGVVAVGDYESIQTVTVGVGGASNATFTSIPSTYKHLQIRVLCGTGGSASQDLRIRYNSDSSTNYTQHNLIGSGSAASADGYTAQTYANAGKQGAGLSTSPAIAVIDILDYANTNKYKTMRSLNGYDANGSGYVLLSSSLWLNTAAISTIELTPNSSTFAQYSSFALYGVK